MAEADQPPAKRKAKATASLNIERKEANRLKRVSLLLRKDAKGLTPEDQIFLDENSQDVEKFYQRREQRLVWQSRQNEQEDSPEEIEEKSKTLAQAIHDAQFLAVYTGAGISTAASIPDYRGPNGIWTRMKEGRDIGTHDLSAAQPTITHMALAELYNRGIARHVVSQNCDGLHLRSGLPKTSMSEVHGNMYIEVCKHCVPGREYVRTFDVTERTGTYKHTTGRRCYKCGEPLIDSIVHFGERGKLRWPLNWAGGGHAANACDTILCLGSSLKVLKKYPWLWQLDRPIKERPKLYIINLQWTPKDKDATLKINGKCDEVMTLVLKAMGIDIPSYIRFKDPIFQMATPLHAAEESTTTRPVLQPSKQEDIDEHLKKEKEDMEIKMKKEEEESKYESSEQLEMLAKSDLKDISDIKSEFPDKLNCVQSDIIKNLKSDPQELKDIKPSESCVQEQNLMDICNSENFQQDCNNENSFNDESEPMQYDSIQNNEFSEPNTQDDDEDSEGGYSNSETDSCSSEGDDEDDEDNDDDDDDDEEDEPMPLFVKDISESSSSTHNRDNIDYYKQAYASTNIELAKQGQAILKQNDYYGTGLCIRSINKPKLVPPSVKQDENSSVLDAIQQNNILENNSFLENLLCNRENGTMLLQQNLQEILLWYNKLLESSNISISKNSDRTSISDKSEWHRNNSACNSSSLPNIASSSINDSLTKTLNDLACTSAQFNNSAINLMAQSILANQMQNINGSNGINNISNLPLVEGIELKDLLAQSILANQMQNINGSNGLNNISNLPLVKGIELKDNLIGSLNSDNFNQKNMQGRMVSNNDFVNEDGVILRTQIVDGVIKTTCITESVQDDANDKNIFPSSTSYNSVDLSQRSQVNGHVQQIARPNQVSLNSQIVSQLALIESQKLQSIWYQSFCNMAATNGELVGKVNESLISEMNGTDHNSPQDSSLILKNIYAAAINDKQKGPMLNKSKETVNENVKSIWFWGFDANADNVSEVSKPINEKSVRNKNIVYDSDIEIIDVESESDDSSSERVSRSRRLTNEPKFLSKEQLIARCHCKGKYPQLCKAASQLTSVPLDDDVLKARNIINTRRIYNYRRFDPEFEIKLENYTYERLKPARKNKQKSVINSKKMCSIEPNENDIEIIYDENSPKENCDSDGKEKEVKDEKKQNPGWYGIGLRKGMKKKIKANNRPQVSDEILIPNCS